MIAWLAAALRASTPVGPAPQPVEKCGVSYAIGKDRTRFKPMPTMRVAGTEPGKFRMPRIDEGKVTSVMCGRASLVPGRSDWLVLDAGVPLFIVSNKRLLVLEIDKGKFRTRMIRGKMTGEESIAVQARLKEFQSYFRKVKPSKPEPAKK